MGKIIPFPLREEFQAEWDDLVDYFSALIHEELSKVSGVEVFTAISLQVQLDAVIGNYVFLKDSVEYRLSFVMPIAYEGNYLTVSLYMGTRFLMECHFTSFHDFRTYFVSWFENLPLWGGK
ncbi:hypothetical protein LQZ19_18725 [Treponema primitia]|uniref:hypothetical protein n=1 Tax=Treponema primitia TaxID=88058 RepID=UPI003980ADB2